jgi:excinuclease ABC subunit A
MKKWIQPLVTNGIHFDFPIHRPVNELTPEQYEMLWNGNEYFKGIHDFFSYIESKTHKIQYRVLLSRYRGRTICQECKGTRLRKDAGYVKICGKSISDLVLMPVSDFLVFFRQLQLTEYELKVSKRLIQEITGRLRYLELVGLGYLTMNRLSSTLSGGNFSEYVGHLPWQCTCGIDVHPR